MQRLMSLTLLLSIASAASAQVTVSGSSCTAAGITSAISTVASSGGGVVSVYCPGTYNITSNLWNGITAPTKVIFGPGTFSFSAQQILPNNTEVSGSGWGTIFQISASASFSTPFDNGLFTNALNNGGNQSSMNAGISLHDFEINGTPNTGSTAGVSFYNIEHSNVYNLYLQNVSQAGIDIHDASDVDVHDNWCVNCATQGSPQHSIGGGINASNDIFVYNKFTRNHATGGGAGSDHYDFFGQGYERTNVRCGFNVIADNTSDSAPTVGIYLDTCNHNTVTGNVIRNAGAAAIACTSGIFNLDGGCSYNNFSNQIQSPAQQGYIFINVYENVVTGGEIYAAGQEAVRIDDANRNKIENVSVYSPSQSSANTYCAITINSDTNTAYGDDNTIQNNTLNDENYQGVYQNKMKTGVCITIAGSATASNITNNVIQNNRINGGTAGSYSDGVSDAGNHNLAACNAFGGAGATFPCAVEHN
jgi:hypothetical protein